LGLNPFAPMFDAMSAFYTAHRGALLLFLFCLAGLGVLRQAHWKTKYRRTMKTVFHRCGLFVKQQKFLGATVLYPLFESFDDTDEEYTIMKYHLRPGQSLSQFEEKKKHFEAAFNSKVIIYGKGKYVFFKIRKVPYDEPGEEDS